VSARDEILGRVRKALADADTAAVPVPRGYRSAAAGEHADVVALFAERVEDYRATVTRCAEGEVAAAIAAALPDRTGVLVPDGFPWTLPTAVTPVADDALSAYELDRMQAVVTTATVGIAETGTIVLTHGPGEGRRAVSLVPDLHVCVVRAGQVVAGVPQAVALLDPLRPQTWISGPSATSDIELNRVEGVHGPRTLHVVLVG
jgi:L-lactate dehydrogenase complex protein LldG